MGVWIGMCARTCSGPFILTGKGHPMYGNYQMTVAKLGSSVARPWRCKNWVAVKELKVSYYIGETLLFTIYIYPLW